MTGADLIVGTSAGAAVAAQLGSGLPLDVLFARQSEPALQARELVAELDLQKVAAEFGELMSGVTSAQDAQRRIGAYALAAETVPEADRRAVISGRLPSPDWPARRMLLVAVDAETGGTRVFDRESGVSLVDAVAASCAVPGVWPPVTIGGHRYIDGGVRSGENLVLAAGCGRIVVISPLATIRRLSPMPLRRVVAELVRTASGGHRDRARRRVRRRDRPEPARSRHQDPGRARGSRPGPGRPARRHFRPLRESDMDLDFATTTELTRALRDRVISSRELLDHLLARVEQYNPGLNAIVALDADRAWAAAAAADTRQQSRAEAIGPLHGLPMTVKDVWETEGLVTTAGAPELSDHIPQTDALAVGRLQGRR